MELILKLTNHDYNLFLDSKIDSFIIALKGFSSDHLIEYTIKNLPQIINDIHKNNKKVYLSLNIISNEKTLSSLKDALPVLKTMDIDGYVVSDFGFLQVLKEENLIDKIIFNPITTITNKYAAKIANELGINHVCIANELNFNDILEIAKYTDGNIEILAQGYYQICNSKRPLITNFFKKLKVKKTSPYYYIKEESRDYAYPLIEIRDDLLIYTDKQRCIFSYLEKLIETKIKYFRIDTSFLNVEEINTIIEIYYQSLKKKKFDSSSLEILEKINSNITCLDNISILKKEAK